MFEDSMSVICPNCNSKNWFNAEHGIEMENDSEFLSFDKKEKYSTI